MSTKSILLLCCCYISDVSFPQWRMTGCCWLAVCRSLALSEGKQTPRNLSKQPRVTQDNVGSLACQCTVGKHVDIEMLLVTPAIVYNAAKLTRYWSKVWPIITIVFWYILRNISVCVNLFYPKFNSDPHFSTVQYGSTQDWRLERRRTVWRWECIVNKARPGIAELCCTGCDSLVLSCY